MVPVGYRQDERIVTNVITSYFDLNQALSGVSEWVTIGISTDEHYDT